MRSVFHVLLELEKRSRRDEEEEEESDAYIGVKSRLKGEKEEETRVSVTELQTDEATRRERGRTS